MKKVCIIEGSVAYYTLFTSLGFIVVSSIEESDLVVFTGGADVSPSLYGDTRHHTTGNDPHRDWREKAIFIKCQELKIPTVGICRGGQFLNVMSGGRMYQDVTKHTMPHEITDLETGDVIYVSSTHHQMMMPAENAVLVASSYLGGQREWYDGEVFRRDVSDQDFEVVYYPHTNSLCFQPHPEFNQDIYLGMKQYFRECLKKYLSV